MFVKLTVLVLMITATSASLLWLRQQRLQIGHDIAQAHRQIDANRQLVWDLRAKVAQRVEPTALNDALARADLNLEPVLTVRQPEVAPRRRPVQVADRARTHRPRGNATP
ncbi:MAG: hypothetical protein WD042_17165 [Phycisphaeraceae bacterium]